MEQQFIDLGTLTFKMALFLSLPALIVGMILGLAVSIFQATTQINEMTLSFIPKIIGIIAILMITMPWMIDEIREFTERLFNMIATFGKIV